jgi:hypothetical protein
MSESFYEQRFAEDIDGLSEGLTASDSDVQSQESDSSPQLKEAIRETVRMIETRFQSRVVSKIEVKNEEKAQGLDDIKQHLGRKELPSNRERTRELLECATLTRIRQNSCAIGDSQVSPLRKGWVQTVVENMQRGVFLNNTDGWAFGNSDPLEIIHEESELEAAFFLHLIDDSDVVLV